MSNLAFSQPEPDHFHTWLTKPDEAGTRTFCTTQDYFGARVVYRSIVPENLVVTETGTSLSGPSAIRPHQMIQAAKRYFTKLYDQISTWETERVRQNPTVYTGESEEEGDSYGRHGSEYDLP